MDKARIEQIMGRAEERCRLNAVRFTDKRKTILKVMLQSSNPLSAYEIADHYRELAGEPIQVMSVYRMLEFLIENALAHKLVSANKYVPCAHIACRHEHETPQFLICERCGSVKEIAVSSEVVDSLKLGAQQAGWKMLSPTLELPCVCDRCSA